MGLVSGRFGAFRSRIGVFLWTTLPSIPVPSTLGAVFVDGKDEETLFVRTSDSSSECLTPQVH